MHASRRQWLLGGASLAAGSLLGIGVGAQSTPRVIAIHTRKWVFVPNRIEVRKGEAVTLEFTAEDVVMGFNAPDFKIRTDIMPGKPTRLNFTADKTGEFTFLCDIFCGDGHEEMSGTLVVT